jgi:hypothetical protein
MDLVGLAKPPDVCTVCKSEGNTGNDLYNISVAFRGSVKIQFFTNPRFLIVGI